MHVLIALSREFHTGSDSILGIFPDTLEGLENAKGALTSTIHGDEPMIFRVPFGKSLDSQEWERIF